MATQTAERSLEVVLFSEVAPITESPEAGIPGLKKRKSALFANVADALARVFLATDSPALGSRHPSSISPTSRAEMEKDMAWTKAYWHHFLRCV